MDTYDFPIQNADSADRSTSINARHMDYIVHACRVHPKTLYAELDMSSRNESYHLSRQFYIPLNYYCLFKTGYGLADLLIMSSEYLTDTEFFKLCYLPGKSVADTYKALSLKPSFTATRLYRYQEQFIRYWHRYDFYRVYKMDALIPILLRNPLRLWRYDNKGKNRESLCGGYNYVYSYRLAERILNIGFARLMKLEAGTATPTQAERDLVAAYINKYGDLGEWKQEFDSVLESLQLDTTLPEKIRPKGNYVVRKGSKGYSILKTRKPAD